MKRLRGEVTGVGLGSAGCRILSDLQRLRCSIDRYVYVSCDEIDLTETSDCKKLFIDLGFTGKSSPSYVRGVALKYLEEIRNMLYNSRIVILIAGLGGCVGSGLSPIVAQSASEIGIPTLAVLIMPYSFERSRHFHAGVALRRLRKIASGVILVDNDELIERVPQRPLLDTYRIVNEKISFALSRMIGSSENRTGLGLRRLFETVGKGGYGILSIFESSSSNRAEEALVGALRSVYSDAEPDEVKKVLLYLSGDEKLRIDELTTSVEGVNNLVGDGSVEVRFGVGADGDGRLSTILLTSGFKSTKFDDYDPLGKILAGMEIDDHSETVSGVEFSDLSYID